MVKDDGRRHVFAPCNVRHDVVYVQVGHLRWLRVTSCSAEVIHGLSAEFFRSTHWQDVLKECPW